MKFLKSLYLALLPPPQWRLPVMFLLAVITGLGLAILRISNATTYLSDDPGACINCHVMTTQYASWQHSSHGRSVTCNDCHVPHDNVIRKYYFKATDGLRHATIFTFRAEPEVIMIKEAGQKVVQENCIRCHGDLVSEVSIGNITKESASHGAGKLCWDCHRETPHGRVNSLSATPFARVPGVTPVFPEWLQVVDKQSPLKTN